MRILIINYRYFISGGPEKYMFNIKKELESHGHTVIPFSVKSNKNVETEYSKYFVDPIGDKDAVYYDDVKKTPKTIIQMLSRSIYSIEVEKALKKEIIEEKPDIVYIIHFVNKLSPSVIKAANDMGVPVVLRLSDYFLLCPRFDFLSNQTVCEDCLKKGYKSCIKKRCVKNSLFASMVRVLSMKIHQAMKIYDKVDAFITPSLFLKNKLIENGYSQDRIYNIPTFTNITTQTAIYEEGVYGLYFGRIAEEKGVNTLIKAYEKLPSLKLKIVGDITTPKAKELIEYINKRNIKNIDFLGFLQGIDLENVIQKSKYVLIPSIWYDNLPNTALEAFAHCKPVIASRIGSLPELVNDGVNGYLFEPGNVDDLVKCINKIEKSDNISTLGLNSYSILKNKFSVDTHYQILMNLFNQLIKKEK